MTVVGKDLLKDVEKKGVDVPASSAPQAPKPENEKKEPKKPVKEKIISTLNFVGLSFLEPFIRLVTGEDPKTQLIKLWNGMGVPLAAFVIFGLLWSFASSMLKSDLGEIPGPAAVWAQTEVLWDDHVAERAKEEKFYDRQFARIEKQRAAHPDREYSVIPYTGKPTFIDQIITSLETVFAGFILAAILALPMGIFMGLSKVLRGAVNPIVQILKPVSPVVWLLLVTMVVSAVIKTNDTMLPKAFIISFISVALCSMWPTLMNTSAGVSSVDKDFINVAKVLQLNMYNKIFKVVLPASLPMVFTGLRISLSIAWMVLIAIELLAQNPGLGKFVWDEFQNGSSNSNAKIIVALFVIGIIGYILDRIMIVVQKFVAFNKSEIV